MVNWPLRAANCAGLKTSDPDWATAHPTQSMIVPNMIINSFIVVFFLLNLLRSPVSVSYALQLILCLSWFPYPLTWATPFQTTSCLSACDSIWAPFMPTAWIGYRWEPISSRQEGTRLCNSAKDFRHLLCSFERSGSRIMLRVSTFAPSMRCIFCKGMLMKWRRGGAPRTIEIWRRAGGGIIVSFEI